MGKSGTKGSEGAQTVTGTRSKTAEEIKRDFLAFPNNPDTVKILRQAWSDYGKHKGQAEG